MILPPSLNQGCPQSWVYSSSGWLSISSSLFSHDCSHSLSLFGGPGCSGWSKWKVHSWWGEPTKFEAGYHMQSSLNPSHLTWYWSFFWCMWESRICLTSHSSSSLISTGSDGSCTYPGKGLSAAFCSLSGENMLWILIIRGRSSQ